MNKILVLAEVGVSFWSVRSKTGPNQIDRELKFQFFLDRIRLKFYYETHRTEPNNLVRSGPVQKNRNLKTKIKTIL